MLPNTNIYSQNDKSKHSIKQHQNAFYKPALSTTICILCSPNMAAVDGMLPLKREITREKLFRFCQNCNQETCKHKNQHRRASSLPLSW